MVRYLEGSVPIFPARQQGFRFSQARRALAGVAACAVVAMFGAIHSAHAQSGASAGKPVVVQMGYTGLTAADWPDMVAIKKGFIAKRGVDLQFVKAQKASINIQSLIGGSLQFVASGVDSAVLPIENGADLVAVAGIQNRLVMRLVGAPGVKSVKDLAGKKLAISRSNGPDVALLRDLMGSAGVKVDPGLFVIAGGTASRLAAVANGGTSATMAVPPDGLRAVKDGMVDLGINIGRTPPRQFIVWITNKTWARENRDTVVKMMQGLKEALHWLNDPANKQEAAEIFMFYQNASKELALQAYDVLVTNTRSFSVDGEIDEVGVQNVLKDIASGGAIKGGIPPLSKYFDMSYFQQAAKR